MRVGLRIDVDTFRGTREGVPNLCGLLAEKGTRASFFFSVGPDNMGRHIWRLLRPAFFMKMVRTRASTLYGWDILLKGTLWPGPVIGEKLGKVIRATSDAGHEVGLHAWDHHAWQSHLDRMDSGAIHQALAKGTALLAQILGRSPACSAAPAWKCNDAVLREKTRFAFAYNSDCRGESLFLPVVDGVELPQPQIPVTLPTYDELIGRRGISDGNYNEYMLSLLKPGKLNVLTVHAEVEGIRAVAVFRRFLEMAAAKGIFFVPLSSFLKDERGFDRSSIVAKEIAGREGWVAWQASTLPLREQT
jgi:undecaprenyl phosphate-alpha-L-ara4FN deformylase